MSQNNLHALGAHVRSEQDRSLLEQNGNEATRRFLADQVAQRTQRRTAKSSRVWSERRVWAPLAVAAFTVLGLFGARSVLWPALEFRVGHVGHDGEHVGVVRDWAQAPADQTLPLRFSDGTRVELEPHARARVVAVARAGADVVIESGSAHVDVVPTTRLPGESAWRIESGPFSVEVKGTRFDVSWDPRADAFALDLFEGVVTVQGCGQATAVRVVAGQGVRASCAKAQWALGSIKELTATGAVDSEAVPAASNVGNVAKSSIEQVTPTPAEPIDSPELDKTSPSAPRRGPTRTREPKDTTGPEAALVAKPSRWQLLAHEGKYAEAYTLVSGNGFGAECERANAEDLLLLGNTARLGGNPSDATEAYTAARRRFPGTVSAARAAYALGRLQVRSNAGAAERWFETYLREEPRGPFSQAASDWLFELAVKGGNTERRRQSARGYLERHPTGAHADDARRLLEQLLREP